MSYLISTLESVDSQGNPLVVYKYRSWQKELHRRLVTQRELLFPHPFDLSDPLDCRPALRPIVDLSQPDIVRQKIRNAIKSIRPTIGKFLLDDVVEARLRALQSDPTTYGQSGINYYNSQRENYNNFGVLSLTTEAASEQIWDEYGDKHRGFAVGFNWKKLRDAINCSCGFVQYCDEAVDFYPLDALDDLNRPLDFDAPEGPEFIRKALPMFVTKVEKYRYEQEYRFWTLMIGRGRDRLYYYPVDAVENVLVGRNISDHDLLELTQAVRSQLGHGVPVIRSA